MPLVEGVIQQSAEWLEMRRGCVTASRVADVMAKLKNGKEPAARRDYRMEIVCEMLTGRTAEHYVTAAMEWGIENEKYARNAYEVETGNAVEEGSLALHDKITHFAASPDGLVHDEGLLEIKCPTTGTHIDWISAGVVPPEHEWQMLAQMACANRQWCDFVSYDPRLPDKFQLYVRRFERNEKRINEMEQAVEQFLTEVVEQVKKLEQARFVKLDSDDLLERLEGNLK